MIVLLVPVTVAVAALIWVGPRSRRLDPRTAAWLTTSAIGVVVTSVLATSWIVSLGLLSGAPFVHRLLTWCLHPMSHATLGTRLIGAAALGFSALSTLHALRVLAAWWRDRVHAETGVRIVVDPRPIAYVLPGPDAAIVVSTGMLQALQPGERQAMLAHEAAHLRHRHDRFLAVGRLVAGIPVVGRRVRDHLHFALERWADEEAAKVVGNRTVVAHAVARAALAQHDMPTGALGMAGGDIVGRVESLLAAPSPSHRPAMALFITVGIAALVQIHHLPEILRMVC